MVRVLLAGGTGLVGRLVVENLLARGDISLVSFVRGRSAQSYERTVNFEALVAEKVLALLQFLEARSGRERVDQA